jgi:hypothetical protein
MKPGLSRVCRRGSGAKDIRGAPLVGLNSTIHSYRRLVQCTLFLFFYFGCHVVRAGGCQSVGATIFHRGSEASQLPRITRGKELSEIEEIIINSN